MKYAYVCSPSIDSFYVMMVALFFLFNTLYANAAELTYFGVKVLLSHLSTHWLISISDAFSTQLSFTLLP